MENGTGGVGRGQVYRPQGSAGGKHAEALKGTSGIVRDYLLALRRDPCSYCGGVATSFDHIVAQEAGGGSRWQDLTATCGSCNSSKGTASLLGYLAWLRSGVRDALAVVATAKRFREVGR